MTRDCAVGGVHMQQVGLWVYGLKTVGSLNACASKRKTLQSQYRETTRDTCNTYLKMVKDHGYAGFQTAIQGQVGSKARQFFGKLLLKQGRLAREEETHRLQFLR